MAVIVVLPEETAVIVPLEETEVMPALLLVQRRVSPLRRVAVLVLDGCRCGCGLADAHLGRDAGEDDVVRGFQVRVFGDRDSQGVTLAFAGGGDGCGSDVKCTVCAG